VSYPTIGCACIVGIVFAVSAIGRARRRSAFDEFTEAVRALVPALERRRGLASTAAMTVAIA
jgi:hypothetical protein